MICYYGELYGTQSHYGGCCERISGCKWYLSVMTVAFVSLPALFSFFFFFQAEDGIRDIGVTGVQTCALPISADPRLIVPIGTCEQHGPHLPFGCDTIIVERLADDLSARFGVLRAPAVEYGVNTPLEREIPGNAAMRKKTLHRMLNDLIGTWEEGGVREFILLTAHRYDPHQEAL